MDGYGLKSKDVKNATESNPVELVVIDTLQAGDFPNFTVGTKESVKIMTGAPVPKGTDSVVKIEDTEEKNGIVKIIKPASPGNNLRYKGEEIKKGEIALEKGLELKPPSLGFIAELEIRKIKVYRKPRLALLITGGELIGLDEDLKPGKIRDTNTVILKSALSHEKVELCYVDRVKDEFSDIEEKIEKNLENCDVVIITGGVSVGEYDYVKEVLKNLGVQTVFWRVSQRPGGPIFFGKKDNILIFGLPGNPASSLVCFYEYIRPSLQKMIGKSNLFLLEVEAILLEEISKKIGKTQFLRGLLTKKDQTFQVRPSGLQGSHILKSFAGSNCLIIFPKNETHLPAKSSVTVHLLPI